MKRRSKRRKERKEGGRMKGKRNEDGKGDLEGRKERGRGAGT